MRFSPKRPDRPRRRPSHGTVVAYLALAVAVLGIPATAVAAGALIHTRNIANGAVTNPKIRNNAVGTAKIRNGAVGSHKIRNRAVDRPKIRDRAVGANKIADGAVIRRTIRNGAINGVKVANNSLTGAQINESTLRITRIAHHITGGRMTAPDQNPGVPYPLTGGTFSQPARTWDLYVGRWQVHFPANCTGYRAVVVDFFENGRHFITLGTFDFGNGEAATLHDQNSVASDLFPLTSIQRHITAEVRGWCGNAPAVSPEVRSLRISVIRFH